MPGVYLFTPSGVDKILGDLTRYFLLIGSHKTLKFRTPNWAFIGQIETCQKRFNNYTKWQLNLLCIFKIMYKC